MNALYYLRLFFVLTIIGLLASCSGKSTTQENSTKKEKTPFWEKKNANDQVNALLKKAQNALKQHRLKPGFLYDTTDVRNFLDNHKAYKNYIQVDTTRNMRKDDDSNPYYQNEFIGSVYISDNLEFTMSRNTWGLLFKAKTEGNANEIFIFTKNGWGVYAVSGRSETGIWKNDLYYLSLNGRTYQSDAAPANLSARATKYLKEHLGILRKRKKRPKK
ncbi:MAG TPA: hypothetical protein DCS93_30920 [Microscillaceae bacterium]|nr:hypothetical protein [Microscillaceae bacterium]